MNKLPRHQRGAAALTVTLLLLFVLTLVVGFASRNLIFEQRSAANQIRATQAFEAAEAGLEWAQALLDSDAPVDAHCQPSTAPDDLPFRERFLAYDAATQRFVPRTWSDHGTPVPLQAACVLTASGWSCSCPSAGHPVLDAPPATGTHPAFAVRFVGVPRNGILQLVATGCDHFAPACRPGVAGSTDGGASVRVQVLLGLVPALATVPVAALTALGNVAADGALALQNLDAGVGGLTVQAGGSITLPAAALQTLPGHATAASLAAYDAQFAGADADHLLTRLLGLDRARWQQLPGARKVACPAECSAELVQAIGAGTAHPLVWIAGDLHLDGEVTLGSPTRPVLVVVDGRLRTGGGVTIHGVVVTRAANWETTGTANTRIHGALIALGNVVGSGTPAIAYDAAVLARLHAQAGSFARVPGSWRDF